VAKQAGGQLIVAFVFCMVFGALCDAQEQKGPGHPDFEPPEAEQQLWKEHIQDRPNGRLLDNFEICEGPLLAALGELDARTAALSTIAVQDKADIWGRGVGYRQMLTYAFELTGRALNEGEQRKLKELSEQTTQNVRRQALPYYGTVHLGNARNLQRTVQEAGSVEECMQLIARKHGWVATHEKSADCGFEAYRSGIDQGLPVLLELESDPEDTEYLVCCGYLQLDVPYIVVARPEQIPLQKGRTMPERMRKRLPEAMVNADKWQMYRLTANSLKDIRWDLLMSTKKPLMRGMRLEKFQKGKYTAHVIHDWRESAEAWHDEIVEIVGPVESEDDTGAAEDSQAIEE
jgi:hypothetical protein